MTRLAHYMKGLADVEERIALGVIEEGRPVKYWRVATARRDRFAKLAKLLGAR